MQSTTKSHRDAVNTLMTSALENDDKGAWKLAINDYKKALIEMKLIKDKTDTDHAALSDIYFSLGNAYRHVFEFPNALTNYKKSIDALRNIRTMKIKQMTKYGDVYKQMRSLTYEGTDDYRLYDVAAKIFSDKDADLRPDFAKAALRWSDIQYKDQNFLSSLKQLLVLINESFAKNLLTNTSVKEHMTERLRDPMLLENSAKAIHILDDMIDEVDSTEEMCMPESPEVRSSPAKSFLSIFTGTLQDGKRTTDEADLQPAKRARIS